MKIYNERAMLEAIEFYELFDEFELAEKLRIEYKNLKSINTCQQDSKIKNIIKPA